MEEEYSRLETEAFKEEWSVHRKSIRRHSTWKRKGFPMREMHSGCQCQKWPGRPAEGEERLGGKKRLGGKERDGPQQREQHQGPDDGKTTSITQEGPKARQRR